MQNSSFSLYGRLDKSWKTKTYEDVLKEKIRLAKANLRYLLQLEDIANSLSEKDKSYMEGKYGFSPYSFLSYWQNEVIEAVEFNNKLLKELNNQSDFAQDEQIKKQFINDLMKFKRKDRV